MTEQEIRELAAILVQEHGSEALRIAQARRDQHRRGRHSEGFLLWSRIAAAVAELLAYAAPSAVTSRVAD
jgi:hypothetical protein